MSLSAKVHSSFWSDENVGALVPVKKLALIWAWTNKDRNNIGYTKASKRQFEFDTGVSLDTLEGACKEMPRSFLFERVEDGGLEVLAVHFAHHQFNDGSITEKNYIYKNLCLCAARLNPRFQSAILERYPILQRGLKLLSDSSFAPSPLEAPPSPQRREEERTEEKSFRRGDARGDFAETPSDKEVFAFAEKYPGEPASGAPVMPRAYAESWVAKMAGRTSGWPQDWKRKLEADWRTDFRTFGQVKKNGREKKGVWNLNQQIAALEKEIASHPANPDSSAYLEDASDAEQQDLSEKKARVAALRKELPEA